LNDSDTSAFREQGSDVGAGEFAKLAAHVRLVAVAEID
jgi:hypothetical protein